MTRRSGRSRPEAPARRRFLKTVPAVVAAAGAVPAFARQEAAPSAPPVDTAAVDCAEGLAGLEFTPDEREMMLAGLERNLESYRAIRALDIPADTEPAFTFHPYRPGGPPAGPATPGAPMTLAPPPRELLFQSVDDLAFLPVTSLAPLIERRDVSSVELTRMYLARLKRFDGRLHAVVTLTEDLALEQAAAADREIADGRYRGPLHGIPCGIKDLFSTRGIRTTWGAKPYEHQLIDEDATIVERLREAGAVLVAKLSLGSLAMGGVWFGGSTRNPWNLDESSSGSSAGPGAATAAGLVGFSIGTETLGSIISPSTAAGVTGLRPSYGRVSRHGAMALSWTMDKVGPMCRTVEDCAVVFNAIYGPDGRDGTVVDAPYRWDPHVPLSSLRIGYLKEEFEATPDGLTDEQQARWQTQQRIRTDALDACRAAGMRLEPMALPDFPAGALRVILSAEAATAFDDLTRSRGIDELTAQEASDWPNIFRTSRFIPAVEYIRAQRARALLMRQMAELMSRWDVFLSPVRSASLMVTNLTGHPALAMKAGFADGLPVALMLTGGLYEEATLLRVALAYEQATEWHRMHPQGFQT